MTPMKPSGRKRWKTRRVKVSSPGERGDVASAARAPPVRPEHALACVPPVERDVAEGPLPDSDDVVPPAVTVTPAVVVGRGHFHRRPLKEVNERVRVRSHGHTHVCASVKNRCAKNFYGTLMCA